LAAAKKTNRIIFMKPSEHIKELIEFRGGKLKSRQVEGILEFLDCQDDAIRETLNLIDMQKVKIKEYKIEFSHHFNFLEEAVARRIKEGWQPFGQTFWKPEENDSDSLYCQTLVKYENVEERITGLRNFINMPDPRNANQPPDVDLKNEIKKGDYQFTEKGPNLG